MTASTREVGGLTRLSSLTALRAMAALLVVGYHLLPQLERGVAATFDAVLRQGFVGVGFFFVLSGFVLTWSAIPGDDALCFYRRRAARVMPAYVVALVAASLVGIAVTVEDLPSLVLLQAWFPSPRVHFGQLAVAWTLSCEAFFYALFPVLLPIVTSLRLATRRALLVGVLLAPALIAAVADAATTQETAAWAAGILPLARLPEFLVGMALAVEVRGGRVLVRPAVALAVVVVAYVAAGQVDPIWATAVMTAPWALLIGSFATADGARLRRPNRVLISLGLWSYALYLTHPLVIEAWVRAADQLDRPIGDAVGFGAGLHLAGLLSACVAGAWSLHVVVERPMERRLRGRQRQGLAAS